MSTGKVLAGIAFGAAVGSALGALYAPDKGSRTRKRLSEKGTAYAEELKSRFNDLIDRFIGEVAEEEAEIRDKAKKAGRNIRSSVETAKKTVKKPVKQAKAAVKSAASSAKKTVSKAKDEVKAASSRTGNTGTRSQASAETSRSTASVRKPRSSGNTSKRATA